MQPLQINGQEIFLEKFYQPWNNSKNSFSNPRIRAVSCSTIIQVLIIEGKIQDARAIFAECQRKEAWNSKIGIDTDLIMDFKSKKDIATICKNAFKDASNALAAIN